MKCPGQDTRFWGLDAIFEEKCPKCGNVLEFFRDDTWRTCKRCGERVQNPRMNFGCAAHCPYAEQCIGSLPPELLAQKDGDLKDRLAVAAKRLMAKDFRLVSRTLKLARRVEEMARQEKGASMAPLLAAAYFLPYAEQAAGGGALPQEERARIGEIMEENGASEELARQALDILDSVLSSLKRPEEPPDPQGQTVEARLLRRAFCD